MRLDSKTVVKDESAIDPFWESRQMSPSETLLSLLLSKTMIFTCALSLHIVFFNADGCDLDPFRLLFTILSRNPALGYTGHDNSLMARKALASHELRS